MRTKQLTLGLGKMSMKMLITFFCCLVLALPAIAQQTGRDRVFKIDAVELIDHQREVEGKVEFQQQQGRYNYLFASEANLKTFQANSAKYEIQLGGACARMGPLSGEGSPKLFAVHEGRLYIFASAQCRQSFLAAPEKLLDQDDAPPATTDESAKRGRSLLDRAVKGIGGAAKIDAITTYREGLSRETESGGTKYVVTNTLTLRMPDGVCSFNCWNEDCWGNLATNDDAWTTSSRGSESMVEAQRTALLRSAGRHPLLLLRHRDKSGTILTSDGGKRSVDVTGEGPIEIELFTLHRDGATTTLGIDAQNQLRLMSYRGRGPTLGIGTLEFIYSGFHEVGGLTLPGRVEVVFEGKPSVNESGAFVIQRVNDESDLTVFQRKP